MKNKSVGARLRINSGKTKQMIIRIREEQEKLYISNHQSRRILLSGQHIKLKGHRQQDI